MHPIPVLIKCLNAARHGNTWWETRLRMEIICLCPRNFVYCLLHIDVDFFLFSDFIHCRLGMCNWTGANFQIFFPETQSKGISGIFWRDHCGTGGMASGWNAH